AAMRHEVDARVVGVGVGAVGLGHGQGLPEFLKKVYDRVRVLMLAGSCGSTMKRTGMSRLSPACSVCAVKQKHSVLTKYCEARAGATDGTALPTMVRLPSLRAKNCASYSWPGVTCMRWTCGWKAHGSFELTPPSNSTVTIRGRAVAAATSACDGPFSRRTPNTFSQASRYSGTSEKVSTN